MKFNTYHIGIILSERQVIDIINEFMFDDTTELLSLHVDLEDDEYQQVVVPIVEEINKHKYLDGSMLEDLCLEVNGFKSKCGGVGNKIFVDLFKGGVCRSNNVGVVMNKIKAIAKSQ